MNETGLQTRFFDGVGITCAGFDDAVELVLQAGRERRKTSFRLVNAGTLAAAASSPDYKNLLNEEGTNFPDGRPLASLINLTIPANFRCEQVRGPSLFEGCISQGRADAVSHFFLGTTEETLDLLVQRILHQFPSTAIAGTFAPPFGNQSPEGQHHQDNLIVESGADLVWVALGTPRQDAEAWRITQVTGLPSVAVGAAFDFIAGTKRNAPTWVTRSHLEWLFRLLCEPRRLGRRYLIGNSRFILKSAQFLIYEKRTTLRAR